MNDNQENNRFRNEEAEPITKKVAKFSAFIYLGLAITVVIVATVGIFNMSYDYDGGLSELSIPSLDFQTSDISMPDISLPQQNDTSNNTDLPVTNEESGVTDEIVSTPPEEIKPSFHRPVNGDIQKNYSMDKLVFSETMKDYRVHSGIDFSAELGEPVVCYTDGVIESINDDYFNGTTVAVSHAGGVVSYYMNLSPQLADGIAVGNSVSAGQQLGTVGESSRSESQEEPHLHFEMRVNGVLIDPSKEIPE